MTEKGERAGPRCQAGEIWTLGKGKELLLHGRPRIMGVLNVTPDSFSDGGRWLDPGNAVAHGLEMEQLGADIIDVGGESTRPGSRPVAPDEEIRRTVPIVAELARKVKIPISIDTRRSEVAEAALDSGAVVINDVSGFTFDERMPDVAARSRAGLVVMHSRGEPRTMQENPLYDDTVAEVKKELLERVRPLLDAGVDRSAIVFDPGIGFAKTFEDNLLILAGIEPLGELGYPLLVGCSRKSFLGAICNREAPDRLIETVATSVIAALSGCRIIRVHDVEENRRALDVVQAVLEAGAAKGS